MEPSESTLNKMSPSYSFFRANNLRKKVLTKRQSRDQRVQRMESIFGTFHLTSMCTWKYKRKKLTKVNIFLKPNLAHFF